MDNVPKFVERTLDPLTNIDNHHLTGASWDGQLSEEDDTPSPISSSVHVNECPLFGIVLSFSVLPCYCLRKWRVRSHTGTYTRRWAFEVYSTY